MTTPHPLRGIALFMLCLFMFACLDTTTKYLAANYEVPLIVAARYGVNLVLMVAILAPRHGRAMVTVGNRGWVAVRALSLCVGSLCIGYAFQRMPVAETTAILFFSPILVILAAGPLLGENVGATGYLAAMLGFLGVLLVVRPGGGLDAIGVMFAGIAMVTNATYQLLSRKLMRTERAVALLFYTVLAGAVLFTALLPWFGTGRTPSPFELLLFASLGVYGGIGHFLYTVAFRDTPASLLAPMNYAQLLFVGLLGWLVFGHIPDTLALAGMIIIAAAGTLAATRARAAPVKRSV